MSCTALGLELTGDGLPEGWIPLEAVVVAKCLNEEGETVLYLNHTGGLAGWDQLGMLHAAVGTTQEDVNAGFRPDRGDA